MHSLLLGIARGYSFSSAKSLCQIARDLEDIELIIEFHTPITIPIHSYLDYSNNYHLFTVLLLFHHAKLQCVLFI